MVEELPVDDIRPNPRNPRENFENIDELADSIQEHGLEVPVKVRPQGDGYELVHGERRLRAVKSLGKDTIRAEVEEMSDQRALEKSVVENLQREDVTELAEARSYQALCDEFDMTQAEVAEKVGKSQSHVANRLRLLNMPDVLQRDILHKILSPWQARILASNWDEYTLRDFVRKYDLSVSELRDVVSQLDDGKERVALRREIPITKPVADRDNGVAANPFAATLDKCVIDDLRTWYEERGIPEEERKPLGRLENFELWADKHIEGYEHERPYDPAERTPEGEEPLVSEYTTPGLYLPEWQLSPTGTTLVKEALEHGYDGRITVELRIDRSRFEINHEDQRIECPDCHGLAYLNGCTIDCPECGGPHELNPKKGGSA